MTSVDKVLQIAQSEVGYIEGKHGYSKYGAWYNQPGYAHAAWCATFVSWVFERACLPLGNIQHPKGFAYCPSGVAYFRSIGRFYSYPQKGDIVFFDWQTDGVSDHVGIVKEVYANNMIQTIEGNTSVKNNSNGGMVMIRKRQYRHCLGFARPEYPTKMSGLGRFLRLEYPMLNGIDVRLVQQQLSEHGYPVSVDGWFGEETKQAIIKFQADKELEVDGVVGQKTWEALNA